MYVMRMHNKKTKQNKPFNCTGYGVWENQVKTYDISMGKSLRLHDLWPFSDDQDVN